MLEQAYAVGGVTILASAGLVASNLLYDRGVANALSRYVAPILGGVAFLVAVLWLDPWTAASLSGVLTLCILALRLGFRRGLRGVEGNLPTQAWAEVSYALAGTASLVVGWGLLGDRWLAFLPIAFMAWGDSIAGLARATIWRGNVASIWPSVAMLVVCIAAAAFSTSPTGLVSSGLLWRPLPSVAGPWSSEFGTITCTLWQYRWLSWPCLPGCRRYTQRLHPYNRRPTAASGLKGD